MSNKLFLAATKKAQRARFVPFDFHVHTLGSADVRIGRRYDKLPESIRKVIPALSKDPADFAAYDSNIAQGWSPEAYYDLLLAKKSSLFDGESGEHDQLKTAILALTDHNVYHYTCAIAAIANQRVHNDGLVILPGVELDIEFRPQKDKALATIHILCIFAPDATESAIRMAISSALNDGGYKPGGTLAVASLPEFIDKLRNNQGYPAMCIAVHVGSSKGIQNEVRHSLSTGMLMSELEADMVRLESELTLKDGFDKQNLQSQLADLKAQVQDRRETIAFEVLKIIGECGFDGLQVAARDDSYHYRRLHRALSTKGRSVPLVSSDAHCIDDIFDCNGSTPFLKVPNHFYAKKGKDRLICIRDEALRFGETRATYSKPSHVQTWLAGIQFKRHSETAVNYWPGISETFYIPFSRNLNCFIGGRGSGKSALLDAIAFIAAGHEYKNEADKRASDRADWYKRAEATLGGWEIKLCWRSDTDPSFSALTKKAKFASRYFDTNHKHTPVEIRDVDGLQLLGDQSSTSDIEFYRIHDIESMKEPELLRRLFDNQRATQYRILSSKVAECRQTLIAQRSKIVELAAKINALTENEASPLRQYARRKANYVAANTDAVSKDYQAVDSQAGIRETFAKMHESWQKRIAPLNPPSADHIEGLRTFFQRVRETLNQAKELHPEVQELLEFIEGDASDTGFENKLLNSLTNIKELFDIGSRRFTTELEKRDEQLRAVKNQLEAKGLPVNAKGREVKKETYEEAVVALEKYKAYIAELNVVLADRRETTDVLEATCKAITTMRKDVATSITSQLATDLDGKVLIIEADAQPLKDQSEFENWFIHFARAKGARNAEERFKNEIKDAFSPRRLSSRLVPLRFSDTYPEFDNIEPFSGILESTCERLKVFKQEKEDVPAAEEGSLDLPEEIKHGVVIFTENDQIQGSPFIDAVLRLDEIVINDQPIIRLNDRPLDKDSVARNVEELSPGQRCSAILPILLLTGNCPLVIDQPEDNLDNRLVRQVIVNILGSIKLRRQVIVATHNPNLPVLGDAEQVVVLRAVGRSEAKIDETGDLHAAKVVQFITDIMEGGREAFQYRESIYSPHWMGGAAAQQ